MSDKRQKMTRVAAALVLLGILVQAISLEWTHPIAFILFAGVGVTATVAGAACYLYGLLLARRRGEAKREVEVAA